MWWKSPPLTITNLASSSVAENAAYTSATPSLTGTPIGAVTYTLGGADAALFTVNASTGVASMIARNFEIPADVGTNNVYDYTLIATDADGNTDDQAVSVTVSDVLELAGQSVIDLGTYGKLIAPVQVEGSWYYYWDRSGDGTSANTGTLNGGVDYVGWAQTLNTIFKYDANGVLAGLGSDPAVYRYATINGVKLALPTMNGGLPYPQSQLQNGTAYTDAGATTNGTTSSYDGLLAIWDAYNGTGTGTNVSGAPPGWQPQHYWSSTRAGTTGAQANMRENLWIFSGKVLSYDTYFDQFDYVALQVL